MCAIELVWRARTILWSHFSHFNFMWIPGIELQLLGLHSKGPLQTQLSHLIGSLYSLKIYFMADVVAYTLNLSI